MTELLALTSDSGWTLYLGVLLSFAILSFFEKDRSQFLLWFRKFGVILGLSLGMTLLPLIAWLWLSRGHYYPSNVLETWAMGMGFAAWVSNILLEIWTLDPIRKHDLQLLPPEESITLAQQKAYRHVRIHAFLCLCTHALIFLS